ncbi:MAG: DNA-binding protein [Desulfuromonas sp.]|nr:MAG: DNA-binding protein [Desulfuromonas sp.]
MSLDPAKMLSVDAVAARLGTTKMNVLMHIKRGVLAGEELDGGWFVTAEALEAYEKSFGSEKQQLCRSACSKAGGCSSCG